MLKKLQLYTICMFVITIVLSQFTLMNEPTASEGVELTQKYQEIDKSKSESKGGFIEDIKNSKYAKPIEEVNNIIDEGNNFMEEIKDSMDTIKEILDIENNINDFAEKIK